MSDWISVDERLPEKTGRYIVNKNVIGKNKIEVTPYYRDEQYFFTVGVVTHWMPLPKPPKGDDDDES